MTRRKPKRSLRPRTTNPNKMIQDEPPPSPPPPPATTQMIQVVEEEEEDEIQELQIQNPNTKFTIEVVTEKETLQQSDEITCTKNPKFIDDEEPPLLETITEEDPKSIEKQDEATATDSVSVHEELQTQSLQMIVEEEEEEEEEEEGDQPSQAHEEEEEEEEEEEDDEEEPEGMALSPMMTSNHNHHQQQQTEGMTTLSPPAHDHDHDHDTIMCELVSESPPPTLTRKSSIRKRKKTSTKYQRKPLNRKQRAVLEVKLQCCKENLQPIPFVPTKTLDFSKHEQLFKRLGLWDFVHIEFDQVIRNDLLAQLIVSYKDRSSTVNDLKIKVNRADLGRALKLPLPVKKDKNSLPPETMDLDAEVLSEESISFLDEFVSNWFLLHEDMWMMPDEVLNNTRCIKEGQPEKVDWPGLIWFMVEKELSQGTKLKSCYYASHLQYLMRSQKDVLFKEEPKLEEEKSMEEKEENAATDVERISLEEMQQEEELGKQHIELAMRQEKDNVEQQVRDDEDVMDFQECKEPGDSSQWFLDGKSNFEEHCFRRCNNVVKIDGLDDQCTVKEEEHEEEKYDLSSKCSLEGLTSTDLLHQGIGTTNITYSPSMQLQLLDDNSGELLHTRSNTHMNQGGPSMFGNTCKRALSHVEEEEEEEEDIQHDIFGGHNKRMRNNGSWENKASDIGMDYCMEQITSLAAKARVIHAQKNEEAMTAQMNQQYLMSLIQQRDDMIATKSEEIQRREIEMYKLEHELRMMSNLLVGYRTALKQTQREFSEYRERCPEPEEPLYKDVPGGGGLVLSTTELEKQRLERDEEQKMQRRFFEELIKKFEGSCIATLEVNEERVDLLDKKLLELEEKFKVRKEILSAKHKMPEEAHKMPEEEGCIAEEEEEEEEEEV